ncbi:hypothetical protein MMC06_003131 [Schaereria dolodes]|nr:hypothetical protein [Schaereria dolodes]
MPNVSHRRLISSKEAKEEYKRKQDKDHRISVAAEQEERLHERERKRHENDERLKVREKLKRKQRKKDKIDKEEKEKAERKRQGLPPKDKGYISPHQRRLGGFLLSKPANEEGDVEAIVSDGAEAAPAMEIEVIDLTNALSESDGSSSKPRQALQDITANQHDRPTMSSELSSFPDIDQWTDANPKPWLRRCQPDSSRLSTGSPEEGPDIHSPLPPARAARATVSRKRRNRSPGNCRHRRAKVEAKPKLDHKPKVGVKAKATAPLVPDLPSHDDSPDPATPAAPHRRPSLPHEEQQPNTLTRARAISPEDSPSQDGFIRLVSSFSATFSSQDSNLLLPNLIGTSHLLHPASPGVPPSLPEVPYSSFEIPESPSKSPPSSPTLPVARTEDREACNVSSSASISIPCIEPRCVRTRCEAAPSIVSPATVPPAPDAVTSFDFGEFVMSSQTLALLP